MAEVENQHQRQARENLAAMKRADELAIIFTAMAIGAGVILVALLIKHLA